MSFNFQKSRLAALALMVLGTPLVVPTPVRAQVAPNPQSQLSSKRILVINGTDAANTAHGASRRVLSQRLNQLKTAVGFQLDSISGSALLSGSGTPLPNLATYDIILFNYWFQSGYIQANVVQTNFQPFVTAFKTWMTTPGLQRGWLGVHSSAANEANEWNWFRDTVSSMHYALHGPNTPAGTIKRTLDTAVRNRPILQGLPDTMRVAADEWYTFTLTAPTWPGVRVLYNLDESTLSEALTPEWSMNPHPMAWYREDSTTGNRFFYTGLIHQNTGGTTPFAEFFAGLVLRGLEYLAGYTSTSLNANGPPSGGAQGALLIRNGELVIHAVEPYSLGVYALNGTPVFTARGTSNEIFRPAALQKTGVYVVRVSSRAGRFNHKVIVP
jgi:hypothetical protein